MPRGPVDIFQDNPTVKVIEVVGYNDGGPFGIYSNGEILKILDEDFARALTDLPGANTSKVILKRII
jgi:hypothetical protein